MVADASGFTAGLQQAQNSLTRTGGASEGASRGFHMMRSAMVGLAAQATGTAGPLSHLTSGLLLFGGGSTTLLAVAAAVGVIASAIHALGAESRQAALDTEQLLKDLVALGPTGAARSATIALAQQLADLQAERHRLLAAINAPGGLFGPRATAFGGPGAALVNVEAQITAIQEKQRLAQNRLNAAIDQAQEALDRILHRRQQELDKLDQVGRKSGIVAREWEAASIAIQHATEALADLKLHDIEKTFSTESLGGTKIAKGLKGPLEDATKDLRELGVSAGRELVLGLIEGMQNMQDVLKRVFFAILDFALGRFFGTIFGTITHNLGGGGSLSAAGEGAARLVGPATMNVRLGMSGLQPLTVFAISRDPVFQQVIRETNLVARQQGFR